MSRQLCQKRNLHARKNLPLIFFVTFHLFLSFFFHFFFPKGLKNPERLRLLIIDLFLIERVFKPIEVNFSQGVNVK